MSNPVLVETTRCDGRGGEVVENLHRGRIAIADKGGEIIWSQGDIDRQVLPRSSAKIIQALPLVESGAADAAGLDAAHLALACASHNGAPEHTQRVAKWLETLGCTDDCLLCGVDMPMLRADRHTMIAAGQAPGRRHHQCSGKHCGFLTLSHYLGADMADYLAPEGAVQTRIQEAFAALTEQTPPLCFAIDGCAAPNFSCTVAGMARATARMAGSTTRSKVRNEASRRLLEAMKAHPELVAGEGRACTNIMRVLPGRGVVKTGADGFFIAALPDEGLGIALKIDDGSRRAAETALAAALIRVKAVEPGGLAVYAQGPVRNSTGAQVGVYRPTQLWN